MTKDEAQRSIRTSYEVVKIQLTHKIILHILPRETAISYPSIQSVNLSRMKDKGMIEHFINGFRFKQ